MTDLVKAVQEGVKYLKRKDDDSFDRLSNRYTVAFLVGCSLFLATKVYVGDPIDCFTPKEFHDNWIKYADNYCWIKNTYYVANQENIPDHAERPARELPYYQWVPIILAIMIAIFSIPVGFWKIAMSMSGYDVEGIVKVASDSEVVNPEELDKRTDYLVNQLGRHIQFHRHSPKNFLGLGNRYGRFLFFMYLITKLLYIAVPIFQLFMLSWMMGDGYGDYGLRALNGIIRDDGNYIENPMFPRVTFCDFKVRRMGKNIHPYTVQCVLTVNLFNERVFLVIWWWLAVLAALSIIGLLIWLVKMMLPGSNTSYIKKYLRSMKAIQRDDRHEIDLFANQYLCLDGVFCVRLLAQNLPDVVTAEIVTKLYSKWLHARKGDDERDSLVDGA